MTTINHVDLDCGTVEVAEYSKADAAITELRQRYADIKEINPDTDDGYGFLKAGIKEVAGYRTALEKKRKEIKDPFLKAGKIIDSEAKRITAELVRLEDPMKAKKAIRGEREKREKEERIARLQQKVNNLKSYSERARGQSADYVAQLIGDLDMIDTEQDFYDLTTEACVAKRETLEKLSEIYTERLAYERAEREREEEAKKRRELEKQQLVDAAINKLKQAPLDYMGKPSSEIRDAIATFGAELKPDSFGDRHAEALAAQKVALAQLEQMAKTQESMEAQAAQEADQDADAAADTQPSEQPAAHFIQPTRTKVDGRRDQVVSVLPPTHGIACQTIPDDQREHAPMSQRRFEPRPGDELITITQREYDELMSESRMLAALMAQGVDQWGGYDRAREELGLSEASAQPF
jgi:hypothetical protein